MRTAQIPPDEFQRMQAILTDPSVRSFLDGQFTQTDTFQNILVKEILTADPLTHYVRGLDHWQDYLQRRAAKPILDGKRTRVPFNFNSANDEEIGR